MAGPGQAPHDIPMSLARIFNQDRMDVDRAWEGFLGGAARDTLTVRTPILDSWERCRSSHVDLGITYAPQLAREAVEASRQENRSLLRAAAQTLADAAEMLAGTDAIMLVTDPDGVVLHGVGDGAAMHAGADIALSSGGIWREGAAGTNGIGVAVRTAKPTLVHAGEHYCERMKHWSCAASPVIDPCDGTVAGILNISARSEFATRQIFALALLGGRRIEQTLLHQADVLRARLLEAALDQGCARGDGLIAIDARGRLTHASSRAAGLLRRRLGMPLDLSTLGRRLFRLPHQKGVAGVANLSDVPSDWVKPIRIDGEVAGYMLIVADDRGTAGRRQVPTRRSGDESDSTRGDFNAIVGDSVAMKGAITRARAFSRSELPVLIEGETGVGKELFARAIHGQSDRAVGAFVALNCGAINRELIASELFGYAPGAFTGAMTGGRAGRFELAHGGTLCLDEVGELPLEIQPYLLRVLEEGTVSRVGDSEPRRFNVRVIAMTNRDLREEVAAGRFRRDLYHRLAIATVTVPPLRERDGDLNPLLAMFCRQIASRSGGEPVRFSREAMARIEAYNWPGNVRELRNLVEIAALLARDGLADVDCLPREMSEQQIRTHATSGAVVDERARILHAIASNHANMSAACAMLGMSRSTLYRRLREFGISRDVLH
jgi:transcriptional regulator of acetoin/glycerol metabolism